MNDSDFWRNRDHSWENIRRMRDLLCQIRKDSSDLDSGWKRCEIGEVSGSEMDQMGERLAWLALELDEFERLRRDSIEGICSGEVRAVGRCTVR